MKTATVFIAAPSDVEAERSVIQSVIDEWNLNRGLEIDHCLRTTDWRNATYPAAGNRPQEFISKQAGDKADIIVGLFWKRFGTPTGFFDSGTQEEIVRGSVLERDVMLYFSDLPFDPERLTSEEQQQAGAVVAFRQKCRNHSLYRSFGTREELKRQFANDIDLLMRQRTKRPEPKLPKRPSRSRAPVVSAPGGIASGGDAIGNMVADTINYTVKNTKSRPVVAAPPGSIGANLLLRNYCQYLSKRYIEYRRSGEKSFGDTRKWHPSVIHQNIASKFGASINLLPESKFSAVVEYLCGMIDKTILGKRNHKLGIHNYSSFADFRFKME